MKQKNQFKMEQESAFSRGVSEFRMKTGQDQKKDPDIITLSSDSEVDDHDEGPTIVIQGTMSLAIDVHETLKATAEVKDEKKDENGGEQKESNQGKDSTTTTQNKVSNDKLEPVAPFSPSTLPEDQHAKVEKRHPDDTVTVTGKTLTAETTAKKGESSSLSEIEKSKLMKLYRATVQKLRKDEMRLKNSIIENRRKREKAEEELKHVNMRLSKLKAAKIREQENLQLRQEMHTLGELVATKARKLEEAAKTFQGVHRKMQEFWMEQEGVTDDNDKDDSHGQEEFQSSSKSYLMKQIEEMSNLSRELKAEAGHNRKESSQFCNDFKQIKLQGLKLELDYENFGKHVGTNVDTVKNNEIIDEIHEDRHQ